MSISLPYILNYTKEDGLAGLKVHLLESIKHGTTTFLDYDSHMLDVARVYEEVGARARLAEILFEISDRGDYSMEDGLYGFDRTSGVDGLNENIELIEKYGTDPGNIVSAMFGPQAINFLSEEMLMDIRDLAEKYDAMIHMHLAQCPSEVEYCQRKFGMTPVEYLEDIGLLNSRMIAAHQTESSREDIKKCVDAGVSLLCCTNSMAMTYGKYPPILDFLEFGGKVALGSDETTSNNNTNMFLEMKSTAITGKVIAGDTTVLPSWKMMRLATIDAAKAIGMDEYIGSLETGKKADMIIIDCKTPAMVPFLLDPIRNVVPNLVYSSLGENVETSIVNGRIIMDNKKVLAMDDEDSIIRDANEKAQNLVLRVMPDLEKMQANLLVEKDINY